MGDNKQPDITVVYVHVLNDRHYAECATQFGDTYKKFPPGITHNTVIVENCGNSSESERHLFSELPNVTFMRHDNSGWDIGAYIYASKQLHCDMAVYFGAHAYFHREGWLKRMADVWMKYGPGFYGCTSTYYVRPHFNTTGIWTSPDSVASYPHNVVTIKDRYEFEHGEHACWFLVNQQHKPTMLVTWDGEWNWRDWRKPQNLYNRGDQTNCLVWNKHNDYYKALSVSEQAKHSVWADTLTDKKFASMIV